MNKKRSPLRVENVRRRNLVRIKNESDLEWKELAKELRVSASHLSQIMSGHRAFTEKTARKIETRLGLPPLALDRESRGKNSRNVSRITDTALLKQVKSHVDAALNATGAFDIAEDRYAAIVEFVYMECKHQGEVDASHVGRLIGAIMREPRDDER